MYVMLPVDEYSGTDGYCARVDGRLSDIFGRKATLCLAMGLFMLGCLLAGFARNIEQLIVFRGIAGVGGGAIISMSQIIISDVVSLRER